MTGLILLVGILSTQDDVPFSVQQFMRGHEMRRTELKHVMVGGVPAIQAIARTYRYPMGQGGGQGAAGGQSGIGRPQREQVPPKLYETAQILVFRESAQRQDPAKLPWLKADPAPHEITMMMGTAEGRRWYGRMSTATAVSLITWVGLEPSEELDRIAVEALWIEEDGSGTRNTATSYLASQGDRLAPLLIDKTRKSSKPETGIGTLAYVRSDLATEALVTMSREPDPVGDAARRALLVGEPRPKAKTAYLEMLKTSPFVGAAKAAAQFGWREALPDVQRHLRETKRGYEVLEFLAAERNLSGRPLPAGVLKAYEQLGQVDDVQRGLHYDPRVDEATLASLPDNEAVAWLAYSLYAKLTKAETTRSKASGLRLLKGLPKDETRRLVERLARMDDMEKRNAAELRPLLGL